MSEQSQLREGIDAAKRGDKLTARRLLQQVLSADGNNELALMWMASVVDTINERRYYLEQALKVNPKNARAREALRRLGINEPEPRGASSNSPDDYMRRVGGRDNSNLYLIAAAVVAIIVIALIVGAGVAALQPQPSPTRAFDAQLTFAAILNPTNTPTQERQLPTSTMLPGIVVTLDRSLVTQLPPSFTPTFTNTPTETPQPSATPLPLNRFTMIYSDIDPGAAAPSLYQGKADGTGEQKLDAGDTGGFDDLAFDPTGQRIAFVRPIADDSGNEIAQVFVGSLASPQDAQPITTLEGAASHPSWSPDGNSIVFSADVDGDQEILIINPDGSSPRQLTDNTARDFDPSFSPDGKQIVYASDVDSPGFTEIYVMNTNGGDITRLTEVPNCYSPAWSPDGAHIAYVSDQQGDGDIYVMDANGQGPVLLNSGRQRRGGSHAGLVAGLPLDFLRLQSWRRLVPLVRQRSARQPSTDHCFRS